MSFWPPELRPKLWTVVAEGYSLADLRRDTLAGLVVGIVALPLAIAFGIASGLRPEQGLYTGIVAGFLISLLGGSRVQIGGPTGAFVVIVAGVVAEFGYQGLVLATMMAGALLVLMAVARLGDVIRFVPYPVIVGFTSGIAVIIAVGQVADGLGLAVEALPARFFAKLEVLASHLATADPQSLLLVVATIALIQLWPRLATPIPGPLVALLATTALAHGLGFEVDTIASRFGSVPTSLPAFRLPVVDWDIVPSLVSPAISIALLGAIESLLSALVADGQIGGRHRSNAELLGQGIANIVSPLFGGMPATGAIARTATNVRNGGRTPVAGMVHSAALLGILVVAGRWAGLIPMATLAGILLVVAYNMSEWHAFVSLLRGPRSDVLVLLATFVLTVAVDLTVAIQAGMVLASLLFMRRMAEVTQVRDVHGILDYEAADDRVGGPVAVPEGVHVFEIHGTFCFGAARKFTETLLQVQASRPRAVILRMRNVLAMDATGLKALEDVAERLRQGGAILLLSGVQDQPLAVLERSGALQRLGRDKLLPNLAAALARLELPQAPGAGSSRP